MTPEPSLGAIEAKINMLHGDVTDVKLALRDMASAITRLAILDERQVTAGEALGRAFKMLEEIESRVSVLERQDVANKQISAWLHSAIGAAGAIVITVVLKKLGFL